MHTKFLMSLASGVSMLVLASAANAALITDPDSNLTLDTNPPVGSIVQQTNVAPCVIGPPNCNNPAGFDLRAAGSGGGGSIFTPDPITYSVSQITALMGGNTFTVGLDFNQTSVAQTLYYFTATYDVGGAQSFDIQTVVPVINQGEGFSDFLLTGFVIPAGATTVTFSAQWFNNDGADRFFLIAAPSTQVPEPSTLAVLGMGLFGLGVLARRRKA